MPTAVADRPWHFLPVGILAFLWHALLALVYTLAQFELADIASHVPEDWLIYLDAVPLWVTGTLAVGIWVGLLGAILLLVREHWAPLALAVAFFAVAAVAVWMIFLSVPPVAIIVGPEATWLLVAATIGALLLWLYARWMRRIDVIT